MQGVYMTATNPNGDEVINEVHNVLDVELVQQIYQCVYLIMHLSIECTSIECNQ